MLGLYNYWLCFTSFKSSLGKEETRMFYVYIVITFSVFLELLWKSTLLMSCKLHMFRPPWMNQFDICALLLGVYAI